MTNAPIEQETAKLTFSRDGFFWAFWSLLAVALIGFTWNARPVMSPNDGSRWDTVWSLVEYGTYEIFDTANYGEKQQFGTIDKVVRRHDGKTISSKPPLLPTVIAYFVEGVKQIIGVPFTKDLSIPGKPSVPGSVNIYSKLTLWVFQIAPFLICLILYKRYLDRVAQSSFSWTMSLLTMGLGTLVTGYLVTLNNHVIGATFAFIATYLLLRIVYDGQRQWWRFLIAGLAVGWTAANELPAALFALLAVIVVLATDFKRGILFFLPPLLLIGAAFLYTNYLALGDPNDPWKKTNFIPAYLQKDLYQKDATGEPSYWARKDKSGIDALNDHPEEPWVYVLHSFIGHHGIFSLSPILLFTMIGLVRTLMGRDTGQRVFAALVLFVGVVVFAFYLFVTDQRNYGGFCHGLRWGQWMSLVWLLFLPGVLDSVRESRTWVALYWGALGVSVLSVFDTWYNPWTRAWLHRILLWFGVIDY